MSPQTIVDLRSPPTSTGSKRARKPTSPPMREEQEGKEANEPTDEYEEQEGEEAEEPTDEYEEQEGED